MKRRYSIERNRLYLYIYMLPDNTNAYLTNGNRNQYKRDIPQFTYNFYKIILYVIEVTKDTKYGVITYRTV